MKTKFCFYPQLNYPLLRTAIEAEILFAARIMLQVRFLGAVIKPVHPCTGLIARFAQQNALLLRTTDIRVGTEKKTPRKQSSSGKKIEAESAVPILVYLCIVLMVHKYRQSAKESCLLKRNTVPEVFSLTAGIAGSGKTKPFEKRRSRYKEIAENKAEAYRVYVEHLFSACDAVDARIFSKGDGETITYTYDKGGQLKGVSGVKNTIKGSETYSYIDTIVYDEHGQRVYIKYGNGVETKYRYDDKRRWLKDIETRNKQTDEIFQKIRYSFDKVGNVLGYSNDASVYETSQSYTYDNLYQLIGVEGTSNQYKAIKSFGSTPVHVAKYKQDFAFDGIGNMTKKTSTTNISGARGNAYPNADLDYSLDYEYDPAYAHRLVHAGNRYYRYDANGNITAEKDGPFTEDDEFIFTYSYDPDTDVYGTDYGFGLDAPKETEETHPENLFAYRRNYTWNEKNLLTKSSDRSYTVHYRYGEDGQRALKYTEEGRSETLYFNNFYTIHIPVQDKNNPQGLRVHKHIFVGNSRLVTAMTHTDNNGDNAEQREKRYYYHSDHLGSAQFVTDWRGKQYEHIEYTPYGELWIEEVAAGLDKLPFRFTGKEMDEETGLYYYGARYLDPKYSRWISTDPALSEYMAGSSVGAGGIYNTVNFNVYHYGNNNPIKYTDPTGMWIDNGDGTYTAEKGDTLWDKYGADWKEKSGFTRDPRTLQVGETVGEKNIPTYSDASAEMKQQIPQGNAQYSNEQDTPSPLVNSNPGSKGYSRGANIAIGLGEILLGIGFYVGSTITAVGIDVTTEGAGSYYAGMAILEGYATGSLLFAYGITRLAGSNNQKFKDDIVGTFVLPEVDVANSMNDYSKRRNK